MVQPHPRLLAASSPNCTASISPSVQQRGFLWAASRVQVNAAPQAVSPMDRVHTRHVADTVHRARHPG